MTTFKSTGAYDAAQGMSGLFNICLQNDDVQDFDQRWDQILLGTSELPHENVLEVSYTIKLQGSDQLQTLLALYNQELNRDRVTPSCQRLRTMARQHVDQTIGRATSKPGMKDLRREHSSRVIKEETSARKGKWRNAFSGKQLDSAHDEILVV